MRVMDAKDKRVPSMDVDVDSDANSGSEQKESKDTQDATGCLDELDSDKKLKADLKRQMLGSGKKMIKQECLPCGAGEMAYEARQLRSVDEGQTLFFECLECGHKSKLDS